MSCASKRTLNYLGLEYMFPKVISSIGMRNLACIALLGLNGVTCVSAAVALIGPNLRNGSFESGLAAPWLGSPQVLQDPAFASDGSWYALVQASGAGTARNGPFQFFPTSKENGLTFSLD